jgi:hypothetical protein
VKKTIALLLLGTISALSLQVLSMPTASAKKPSDSVQKSQNESQRIQNELHNKRINQKPARKKAPRK